MCAPVPEEGGRERGWEHSCVLSALTPEWWGSIGREDCGLGSPELHARRAGEEAVP